MVHVTACEEVPELAGNDALDLNPVIFDRRLFSDDLIRDLGGDPGAQGLS